MSWLWDQLPPPGTHVRAHVIAFAQTDRPGMKPMDIAPAHHALAYRDLGVNVGLRAYGAELAITLRDPPNLDHLRDAWRGAASIEPDFVFDVLAQRWWKTVPTEFFIENELSLNFEGAPSGHLGHVAHTVGMAKFGRPEIAIAGLTPEDGPRGAKLLLDVARVFAGGSTLKVGPRVLAELGPLRLERNTLPVQAPHFTVRDAGMGPPVVRRYLKLTRG